jgi:hypothetical protein
MSVRIIQIMPIAADWVALRPSEDGFWQDPVCALALVEEPDDDDYRYIEIVTGGDFIDPDADYLAFFHKSFLDDPEVATYWAKRGKEQWQADQAKYSKRG